LKRLLSFLNFVVLIGSWIALATTEAHAWGPGIHIVKGSYILENLHLILPSIAQLLRACPRDFLYGCISADFFIGKGHRRRDDHCHNWSVGLKMLATANTPANEAFCYGYLAHLAADIVAHKPIISHGLNQATGPRVLGIPLGQPHRFQLLEPRAGDSRRPERPQRRISGGSRQKKDCPAKSQKECLRENA